MPSMAWDKARERLAIVASTGLEPEDGVVEGTVAGLAAGIFFSMAIEGGPRLAIFQVLDLKWK
jgi:hypothetical protein